MRKLLKQYREYLENITREQMFDANGMYNTTLREFHDKFAWYRANGNKTQRIRANFLLSLT